MPQTRAAPFTYTVIFLPHGHFREEYTDTYILFLISLGLFLSMKALQLQVNVFVRRISMGKAQREQGVKNEKTSHHQKAERAEEPATRIRAPTEREQRGNPSAW